MRLLEIPFLRQELWGGAFQGGVTLELDLGGDLDVLLSPHRVLDRAERELFGAFCAAQTQAAPTILSALWGALEGGFTPWPWEEIRCRTMATGWQLVPWEVMSRSLCWRFWELAASPWGIWRTSHDEAVVRAWTCSKPVAEFIEAVGDNNSLGPGGSQFRALSVFLPPETARPKDVSLLQVRVGNYPAVSWLATARLGWKMDLEADLHSPYQHRSDIRDILRAALALALAIKRRIFRQVVRACTLIMCILFL